MPYSRLMSIKHSCLAGAVSTVALSLAACGGSSSSTAKAASTPPSSTGSALSSSASSGSASATPSASATAAAVLTKAQLAKVVLQQADVPTGWKPAANSDTAGDSSGAADSGGAEMAKCIGLPDTGSDAAADVQRNFSSKAGELDSEAESYKHASSIETDKQVLASPKLKACFAKLIESAASSGAGSSQVKVTTPKFTFQPTTGNSDGVLGVLRGSVTISGPGGSIPLYLDLFFAERGQTEVTLGATTTGTEFPLAQSQALLKKMLSRLPA